MKKLTIILLILLAQTAFGQYEYQGRVKAVSVTADTGFFGDGVYLGNMNQAYFDQYGQYRVALAANDSSNTNIASTGIIINRPISGGGVPGMYFNIGNNSRSAFFMGRDYRAEQYPYMAFWLAEGYSSPGVTGDVLAISARRSDGFLGWAFSTKQAGIDTAFDVSYDWTTSPSSYGFWLHPPHAEETRGSGIQVDIRGGFGLRMRQLAPPAQQGYTAIGMGDSTEAERYKFGFDLGNTGNPYLAFYSNGNLVMQWKNANYTDFPAPIMLGNSGNAPTAGADIDIQHNNYATTGSLQGIQAKLSQVAANNPTGSMVGFSAYPQSVDANLGSIVGFAASGLAASSGTTTDFIGFSVGNPDKSGSGAFTNVYGLFVGNLTAGTTNNYAIYSVGSAPSLLSGPLTITGTSSYLKLKDTQMDSVTVISDSLFIWVGGTPYGFKERQ